MTKRVKNVGKLTPELFKLVKSVDSNPALKGKKWTSRQVAEIVGISVESVANIRKANYDYKKHRDWLVTRAECLGEAVTPKHVQLPLGQDPVLERLDLILDEVRFISQCFREMVTPEVKEPDVKVEVKEPGEAAKEV